MRQGGFPRPGPKQGPQKPAVLAMTKVVVCGFVTIITRKYGVCINLYVHIYVYIYIYTDVVTQVVINQLVGGRPSCNNLYSIKYDKSMNQALFPNASLRDHCPWACIYTVSGIWMDLEMLIDGFSKKLNMMITDYHRISLR